MPDPNVPIRTVAIAAAFRAILLMAATTRCPAAELPPSPGRGVVLAFDDGNRSDIEFVAPLLRQYGLGATFFASDYQWMGLRPVHLKCEYLSDPPVIDTPRPTSSATISHWPASSLAATG